MTVYIIDHCFHYEIENICRIFYPNAEIKLVREFYEPVGDYVITTMSEKDGITLLEARAVIAGRSSAHTDKLEEYSDKAAEWTLARCLFECLKDITDYTPAWGLLTGVRPSKLMNMRTDEMGLAKAKAHFINNLLVSPQKTELAAKVALTQTDIIASNKRNSFSLYVSIPFCPSRCSYCSFVSHSITSENAKKLFRPYLDNLKKEIEITGKYAADNGLCLESVYFGGGTPGILSADESVELIEAINSGFDLSSCREYTFEAGRADTITAEKLAALKENGVDRVSINPQTFNDRVLETIGRKHTAAQALAAFALARKIGFNSINTDLIAGLPGDTFDSFKMSLDKAVLLRPENITVHALALKRSSRLVAEENACVSQDDEARKMIDCADETLTAAGYVPYYMYRQSRCVGNLENVGWCLPGYECIYNIFMMEEIHTVLAVGAGAVTKLKAPGINHIERIFNFKYPYEYISRFDELLERKCRITQFYSTYN